MKKDLESLERTGDFQNHPELLLEVAQSGKKEQTLQRRLFGRSLSDKDLTLVKLKAYNQLKKLEEQKLNLELLIIAVDTFKHKKAYERKSVTLHERFPAIIA